MNSFMILASLNVNAINIKVLFWENAFFTYEELTANNAIEKDLLNTKYINFMSLL